VDRVSPLVRRLAARLRNLPGEQGGQALVEFALVMPVLLGFFVGIVEIGQAWRSQQVLTHAVREATRLAIVPTSTRQQVSDRVKQTLAQGGLDTARAQMTLALRGGTGTLDTVRVVYPHAFPLLGPVVRLINPGSSTVPPGSVQLSSIYVMRNE
jgi:Flp pilus assembly protein TadG